MWTTSSIKRFVVSLSFGKLFTTRECLLFGPRNAVDQALSRLVKRGMIVRVARGVFMREGSDVNSISVLDVARVKAESFGRKIATWSGHVAVELGIVPGAQREETFYVDSSSSSFKFGDVAVHFKKTCPRKLRLGDNPAGRALKALWHIGKRNCSPVQVMNATRPCLRWDREEIRFSLQWLPDWLSSYFVHRPLPLAYFRNLPPPVYTAGNFNPDMSR